MEPVTIEKHGRPVVVVMSLEEYGRLLEAESERQAEGTTKSKQRTLKHEGAK